MNSKKLFRAILLMAALLIMIVWFLFRDGSSYYQVLKTTLNTDGYNLRATTSKEMTKRVEEMNRMCTKYNVSSLQKIPPPLTNRRDHCNEKCPLLTDEKNRLMMCHIQKAGSSTLKSFLLKIQNKSITAKRNNIFHFKANNKLLRLSSTFLPKEIMDTFFKGLYVRHPFDRLVSTYADKISPNSLIINNTRRNISRNRRSLFSSHISFREFVRVLIRTNPRTYDKHWTPYWSRCDLCHTRYDFFIRLEKADEDTEFILQRLGINHFTISKMNRSKRNDTMKYFKELNPEEIVALYKKYFLDFKLFGYSVEEFLPNGTDISIIDNSVVLRT